MKKICIYIPLILITTMNCFSQDENLPKTILGDSGYDCHWIKNEDFCTMGYLTFDCFDNSNKLIKQLNSNLCINSSFVDDENKHFIIFNKKDDSCDLIGNYLNDKPFSGFFMNKNAFNQEWLMMDFYKDGNLIYQLYNDVYQSMKDEESNISTNYKALQKKNKFENGLLVDGLEILSEAIEEEGTGSQIVRYVKNGKTDHLVLGLFAMHYAEIVSIKEIENGYIFDSYMKEKVRITYNQDGRKFEKFDLDNNLISETNFIFYDLNDLDELDGSRDYSYIKHKGKIFIEQAKNGSLLNNDEELNQYPDASDLLPLLTNSFFYHFKIITPNDVLFFLKNMIWDNTDALGTFFVWHGLPYGVVYEKGELDGTYTVMTYNEESTSETTVCLKNKTVDEIVDFIKAKQIESVQKE